MANLLSVILVRFEQVGSKDCAGSKQNDVDVGGEGKESHLAHHTEQLVDFAATQYYWLPAERSKFDRR